MASIFTDMAKKGLLPFSYSPWDSAIYSGCVVPLPDGTYRMCYTGYSWANIEAPATYGPCTATSPDGRNWTKPNLGQVSFGGNTNNNIFIGYSTLTLTWYGFVDGQHVAVVRNDTSTSALIYTSPDGVTWTFLTTAFSNGTHGAHIEPKCLLFVGGEYRIYYSLGHFLETGGRRSIGYYSSATLGGVYADQGLVTEWTSPSVALQFYDINHWTHNDVLYAAVPIYAGATDILGPTRVYASTDGAATWALLGNIVVLGELGSWDGQLITTGNAFKVGDTYNFIYGGSRWRHFVPQRGTLFGWSAVNVPYAGASQVTEDGAVMCDVVARGFAGAAGDALRDGTRHTKDGRMYVTTDAPSGANVSIAGILHTDTGIRYVTTSGSVNPGPRGFAVTNAGVQLVTTTPTSPVSLQGISRGSDGAMFYSP